MSQVGLALEALRRWGGPGVGVLTQTIGPVLSTPRQTVEVFDPQILLTGDTWNSVWDLLQRAANGSEGGRGGAAGPRSAGSCKTSPFALPL